MVVLAYYPWAETRVQREAEALVAQGYQVDVICLQGPRDVPQELGRGVQVYRVPLRLEKGGLRRQFLNYLQFFVLAAVQLTRLHWRQPYRVVQVHNLPDFMVFCALIPKWFGARVILDLHDLMPEFYASRFGQSSSWLRRLVGWQESWSCKFADHVITVSEHWRQALIRRGVPAAKCSVVMNVADESIFHSVDGARPRSSERAGFRLIYHGTIVYRYGLDLAIQAIDQVRHEIPDIHLTIVGGGDHVSTLARMVEECGLARHVTIHKPRPAEELPAMIQAADVGIVPYRNDVFTDSLLPTKLMEYAVMGLPCIAARTTAIQAYYSDAMVEFFEPGSVDDLARCILDLYRAPDRMEKLARGAEKFNQRYNWRNISAEYVALVERLGQRRIRRVERSSGS